MVAKKLRRVLLQEKESDIRVLYTIDNELFSFDIKSFEIKPQGP